jgi:RNA polymerase sigma factor (sigma-70 family)
VSYKDIIELLRVKDNKAYEALYILYADKFYGFSISKWNFSEEDGWEVVYQTLETLGLKLANYEFESQKHFDAFIFKVFVNFLRQKYRSNRRKEKDISFVRLVDIEFGEKDEALEDVDINKIESAFSNEVFNDYYQNNEGENPKLIWLKSALSKLESTEKEILLLKAQNFTYDEIAVMLKIENNQLKVKHHRAKKKLLKMLEENKSTIS